MDILDNLGSKRPNVSRKNIFKNIRRCFTFVDASGQLSSKVYYTGCQRYDC